MKRTNAYRIAAAVFAALAVYVLLTTNGILMPAIWGLLALLCVAMAAREPRAKS